VLSVHPSSGRFPGIVIVFVSCLINAQPLPAHLSAAAQGHDLAHDWSLLIAHVVAADAHFGASLGAFFYYSSLFHPNRYQIF